MDDATAQADVVRDTVEPGAEFRLRAEAGQAPPCAQKGFLRHVYRFLRIARHTKRKIVDTRLVPFDQAREGIIVPRLPAPDQ